ncbi:helix-turn-helix domain-containing protein [Streptomyces sp. NPDC048332]|uniref:helix-turn-helix domain-containing protein n=1 Tax=unclassified Streptomyces TaxID=2593676 RepID=UPI00342B0F8C
MARWTGLPESLDPHLRQLVVLLREHKDRKALSIAALAVRTGFGKSSWDRYLNGRALPPEEAVEALARVCDVEAAPLLELRELAASAPGADEVLDEPGAAGAVSGRQSVPWFAMVMSSVTTALVMLLGLMLLAPWEGGAGASGTADGKPLVGPVHPSLGTFAYKAGTTYECQVQRDTEDGLLYAGYSRTRSEPLQRDASGWSVVEAQCLLEHHGVPPGTVDGAYGNNTDRAVRRLQDKARIAVDGIAGPDTWKVLRK